MEVTITQISRKEKTSTKTGRPFTSVGIRTKEHGERWLSGFGNKDNAAWKAGDVIQIDVVEKGEYLNFTMPTVIKNSPNDAIVARLENFVTHKLEPLVVKLEAAIDRVEALGGELAGEKDEFPMPDFGEDKV